MLGSLFFFFAIAVTGGGGGGILRRPNQPFLWSRCKMCRVVTVYHERVCTIKIEEIPLLAIGPLKMKKTTVISNNGQRSWSWNTLNSLHSQLALLVLRQRNLCENTACFAPPHILWYWSWNTLPYILLHPFPVYCPNIILLLPAICFPCCDDQSFVVHLLYWSRFVGIPFESVPILLLTALILVVNSHLI